MATDLSHEQTHDLLLLCGEGVSEAHLVHVRAQLYAVNHLSSANVLLKSRRRNTSVANHAHLHNYNLACL